MRSGSLRPGLRASVRALLLALVLGGLGSEIELAHQPLANIDASIQDAVLARRAPESYLGSAANTPRDPRNFITIVAIDERTLSELGAYNGGYPRAYHAQVLENLLAAPPRVIALDVGFFESTPEDPLLATALAHARSLPAPTTVVLSAAGLPPAGESHGELTFDRGLQPVSAFSQYAQVALANVVPDDRGTIRGMPLVAYVSGVEWPSLGLAAMAAYLRRPTFTDGRSADSIQLAGRAIPVDTDEVMRINFFGPPSRAYSADATFRVVSFVDVLRGRIDPAVWRGGLVFVGALGATGLADDYWTPTSDQGRKMAGVEIHANAAATLFSTNFLRVAPPLAQTVLIIGVALLLALLAANATALLAVAMAPFLLGAIAMADVFALYAGGWLIPIVAPLLIALLTFVAELVQRLAADQCQIRHAQAALAAERAWDRLTGLANRAQLLSLLRESIQAQHPFGVLVLNVERFRDVNDTLGHDVGDAVLKQVADRLTRTLVGVSSKIARLGADEFAVIVDGADAARASTTCAAVLDSVHAPLTVAGQQLSVSASIGVAMYPQHGDDPEALLRHADAALQTAKQGHHGFVTYTPDQGQRAAERLELVSALHQAISSGELRLYYQPRVHCHSGRVSGVEALVRWWHPVRGLITPERFIPLAEQTGLIRSLTRWVLEAAASQARAWHDLGMPMKIAVNLSPYDLQDPELPGHVAELLARHAVPWQQISVEITESALVADPHRALQVLSDLAGCGVDAALDDFGTGYSSLSYLQQLPVREIKIDASFVRGLAAADRDRTIVRSTIELGHQLGLSVVAEGVEDRITLDLLAELGCDQAQGYYLSRPLPAEAFVEWLRQHELDHTESRDAA